MGTSFESPNSTGTFTTFSVSLAAADAFTKSMSARC